MVRNSGAEKIEKNQKSHFCDNLVPTRPENFWSRGVKKPLTRRSFEISSSGFLRMIEKFPGHRFFESLLTDSDTFPKFFFDLQQQFFDFRRQI